MTDTRLQLDELHTLIAKILVAHDTAGDNAAQVAKALVAAEADGQKGHGASRVPSYAAQARSGKVDGHATPEATRLTESAAVIDARDGFAYPAIELAQRTLLDCLAGSPVAAAVIRNSHHSGVIAHHIEPLARAGCIAMSVGNGPQAIAPWGGRRGLFGTNPIGFAAPRDRPSAARHRHEPQQGGARPDQRRRPDGRSHPLGLGVRFGRQSDDRRESGHGRHDGADRRRQGRPARPDGGNSGWRAVRFLLRFRVELPL